jgi:hypothetical protein
VHSLRTDCSAYAFYPPTPPSRLCAHTPMLPPPAGPHNTYREVSSASLLDSTVTVLPLKDVLARYPGMSQQEALQQYEQDHVQCVEKDPGVKGPGDHGGVS